MLSMDMVIVGESERKKGLACFGVCVCGYRTAIGYLLYRYVIVLYSLPHDLGPHDVGVEIDGSFGDFPSLVNFVVDVILFGPRRRVRRSGVQNIRSILSGSKLSPSSYSILRWITITDADFEV